MRPQTCGLAAVLQAGFAEQLLLELHHPRDRVARRARDAIAAGMRTHPGQIGAALRRSKIKVHAGKLFAEGLHNTRKKYRGATLTPFHGRQQNHILPVMQLPKLRERNTSEDTMERARFRISFF